MIRGNYKYNRDNILVKIFDFISYRLILTLLAFIYIKLMRRIKIRNRKALRVIRKEGAIIYANHTHAQADAFGPSIYAYPRKVSIVVNSANVSLPVLGNMTKSWGAMPLPGDYESSKNFLKEFENRLKHKHLVVIYPEAHLWPYYTGIRPFTSKSFTYSSKFKVKTYVFTTVYRKKKNGRLKTELYIDGPFMFNEALSQAENASLLRDKVYEVMTKRSELSLYEKIRYVERKEK